MNDLFSLGKVLLIIGLIIAGGGLLMMFADKIPWVGRLPGDIYYKGKNATFYFPLATGLIISIVLTLILWLINRK